MKRFISICLTILLFILLTTQIFAASPNPTMIDLGVENLGGGILCHSVMIIEDTVYRASTKSGSITKNYTSFGNWIGTVQLNGSFTYDGRTATAIAVSASHSTANGWSYGGESARCSGNSVTLTAQLSGIGKTVPVSASLSCSPNGTLS